MTDTLSSPCQIRCFSPVCVCVLQYSYRALNEPSITCANWKQKLKVPLPKVLVHDFKTLEFQHMYINLCAQTHKILFCALMKLYNHWVGDSFTVGD